MYNLIKIFLDIKGKKNKKFDIVELENFIINRCGGQSGYYSQGGYEAFYDAMQNLKAEGKIKEVKTSDSNKRYKFPMKIRWSLVTNEVKQQWLDEDIIMVSDILDLKTYLRYPKYQTKEEWKYILNIYSFLKENDKRQWASVEERCLELFEDEKFLTENEDGKKNNKVLKRLGLKLEDIKAKQYGEQFIYWNRGVSNIKTIIILENHSTFFSFKKAVQSGIDIFGIEPDALIFGYGNKILSSFSFIDEIADPSTIKVYYFGDIDPVGFSIYVGLREKYSNIDINLLAPAYIELLKICNKDYSCKDHVKKQKHLDLMLKELRQFSCETYQDRIKRLWELKLRIPQELITYEYLLKMKGAI
ncbi:hypothetical protein KQI89_08740 [Clostridium sp. MSJ-4]|uniref:Wadjet protein JetD C-terminal domain-containing protein n=1 Tax=Clostridium simiarum TaxID=2841506 RepID=A0ABS6F0M5_9CLOT|nr:Wadjet anti-phage system protein JetD domain-containing protein [Clostridium simiarum]MBU5591851.1 hypothetical protein [Clostridium simiarum]